MMRFSLIIAACTVVASVVGDQKCADAVQGCNGMPEEESLLQTQHRHESELDSDKPVPKDPLLPFESSLCAVEVGGKAVKQLPKLDLSTVITKLGCDGTEKLEFENALTDDAGIQYDLTAESANADKWKSYCCASRTSAEWDAGTNKFVLPIMDTTEATLSFKVSKKNDDSKTPPPFLLTIQGATELTFLGGGKSLAELKPGSGKYGAAHTLPPLLDDASPPLALTPVKQETVGDHVIFKRADDTREAISVSVVIRYKTFAIKIRAAHDPVTDLVCKNQLCPKELNSGKCDSAACRCPGFDDAGKEDPLNLGTLPAGKRTPDHDALLDKNVYFLPGTESLKMFNCPA